MVTKTMKAMKTPAAKAKGIKPMTLLVARMKTPAAKAQEMKPDTAAEIIIDGAIRVTTPMSPCEILRCLLPEVASGFRSDSSRETNLAEARPGQPMRGGGEAAFQAKFAGRSYFCAVQQKCRIAHTAGACDHVCRNEDKTDREGKRI